jgi:hypothetical protein
MLMLFCFLFSAYVVSLATGEKDDARRTAASENRQYADQTGGPLVTYNRAVSLGLLVGGSLFIVYYCVRRRTAGRTKTQNRQGHP